MGYVADSPDTIVLSLLANANASAGKHCIARGGAGERDMIGVAGVLLWRRVRVLELLPRGRWDARVEPAADGTGFYSGAHIGYCRCGVQGRQLNDELGGWEE